MVKVFFFIWFPQATQEYAIEAISELLTVPVIQVWSYFFRFQCYVSLDNDSLWQNYVAFFTM